MADATLTPEERDTLAGELVLGVLDSDERAQALRLQLADAGFRHAVSEWELRFGGLFATVPEVAPPPLWPSIEARLGGAPSGTVPSIGRRLQAWRLGALASGAVAAALAIMVVTRPGVQAPVVVPAQVQAQTQAIVAQLGETGGTAQLVANYDPDHAELRVRALQMPKSALSPELWVIPAGGVPHSLGLIATPDGYKVAVPEALRPLLKDGAILAVTLEFSTGAPHAAPSSTPIAAGTLHKV